MSTIVTSATLSLRTSTHGDLLRSECRHHTQPGPKTLWSKIQDACPTALRCRLGLSQSLRLGYRTSPASNQEQSVQRLRKRAIGPTTTEEGLHDIAGADFSRRSVAGLRLSPRSTLSSLTISSELEIEELLRSSFRDLRNSSCRFTSSSLTPSR